MRNAIFIGVLVILSACSDAANFDDPYGPRGQGFVGSAYGYSETTVSPGNYIVQYTDIPESNARKNLNRRASELCGQKNANLGPVSVSAGGFPSTIFTASATLSCSNLPPFPTPKGPKGSVAQQSLRSCNPTDIESQIKAITSRGHRLSNGAGPKQISRVQVETLSASISIYSQAMARCNVDKAAYQNAINQLTAAQRQAQANVDSL